MAALKLKRNRLGGLICPLPKEPKILWPDDVHFASESWHRCSTLIDLDSEAIWMGSFTNGNSRMAQLEPLRVFGDSFYHVAFGHLGAQNINVEGERHDSLFVNLKQAREAIRDWLCLPKQNYSKQQAWLSRNRDKMRNWRREYMRQYRAKGNGYGEGVKGNTTEVEATDTGPRDCTKWPAGYGPRCTSDRPCSECNNRSRNGPQPFTCDWCGSFTTRSAEAYCRHIESGCPVLHHRPLRRNKLGGLICPQVPER